VKTRLKPAAYLAHVRRADGSWPSGWAFARPSLLEARQILQQYPADTRLPHKLTTAAYGASEELRASALFIREWKVIQAQVIRIVPVVQQVLRTLAEAKNSA
jgi:hypothetical protein